MREHHQSPLNGGQVQLAKLYETALEAIYNDFSEPFKFGDLNSRFEHIGHGDMLRLKHAGLLRNETGDWNSTKDWFLTQKAKRWLRTR